MRLLIAININSLPEKIVRYPRVIHTERSHLEEASAEIRQHHAKRIHDAASATDARG